MDNIRTAALAIAALIAAAAFVRWRLLTRRRVLGSPADRATYETLHTASQAAPALRRGLDADSAALALPHVRTLLGQHTVAITDLHGRLAGRCA